jgi:hypothetical protein
VNIVRNPKREALVLDQIRASFTAEGPRAGVHLSDLLSPRRSFMQRAHPLPPTNAEVLYWLAGRGHEDALGRVAGLVITPQRFWFVEGDTIADECAPERLMEAISFRPDFEFGSLVPGEFKTRRSNLAEAGEEAVKYESYLEQLRGYSAIRRNNYALLLVLSLLEGRKNNDPKAKTEPALAVYDVFFTDEELEATRVWLEERRDAFVEALRAGNHTILPLCKDWMCGKQRRVVDQLAYCHNCDKTLEAPHDVRHTSTKTGAGHRVQPAVVRWEYEPSCKWYARCRPQDFDPTRGERATT